MPPALILVSHCFFAGINFTGTLIRLPLRGPEAAEKSKLNPHPFKIETASKLFDAFIREVTDGRMLLFLKSVQRIDIYIWENDAPAPVLRASAMKRVPPGMVASLKQAKRIPDSIPDAASSSFESLYDYLIGLGKEEAAQLTNPICNQIVIETYGGDDKVVRSVSPGEGISHTHTQPHTQRETHTRTRGHYPPNP